MLNKDLSILPRKDLLEIKKCQKAKIKMITVIIINIIILSHLPIFLIITELIY